MTTAQDEAQTAHIPGPWVVNDEDPSYLLVESAHYEDETVGVCGPHSDHWPLDDETARLIAAAPDLLAALKLIRDSLQGQSSAVATTITAWCDNAIKQAEVTA